MLCSMLCDVLLCSDMLCHAVLCHVVFCRVRRGREAGYSGILGDSRGLSGQLGVWRPRYAGWGWPGGLFLKSNNPNLSGGEI